MPPKLTSANLDSYYRFFKSCERLTQLIQVGNGALTLTSRAVDGENGDFLLGALVESVGEPWGKTGRRVPEPSGTLAEVTDSFQSYMLVNAMALFDLFTFELLVDMAHFGSKLPSGSPISHSHTSCFSASATGTTPQCCLNKVETICRAKTMKTRPKWIYDTFGLTNAQCPQLWPLFHFFRVMRNCVAHSSGYPSAEMISVAADPDLPTSVAFWHSLHKGTPPALPTITPGQRMIIQPRHVIYATAVCRLIARNFQQEVVSRFFTTGDFLLMAAYNSLFSPFHESRKQGQRTAQFAVNHFYSGLYRVRNARASDTPKTLKAKGVWKACMDQHTLRYPGGVLAP